MKKNIIDDLYFILDELNSNPSDRLINYIALFFENSIEDNRYGENENVKLKRKLLLMEISKKIKSKGVLNQIFNMSDFSGISLLEKDLSKLFINILKRHYDFSEEVIHDERYITLNSKIE